MFSALVNVKYSVFVKHLLTLARLYKALYDVFLIYPFSHTGACLPLGATLLGCNPKWFKYKFSNLASQKSVNKNTAYRGIIHCAAGFY